MNQTLEQFLQALRHVDVRISVAETLDAYTTVDAVGLNDRALLKDSLAVTLAKTAEEKTRFDETFDMFFAPDKAQRLGKRKLDADEDDDGEDGNQVPLREVESDLAKIITEQDETALQMAIQRAAKDVQVQQIWFFTQKGIFTRKLMEEMGLKDLDDEIARIGEGTCPSSIATVRTLQNGRAQLFEAARDYVEQQFQIFARKSAEKLHDEFLEKMKLSNIDPRDFKRMQDIVRRMAKRLIAMHARRRRVARRGHLDVRRTLRTNYANDGMLFDLHWKYKKVKRPRVVAICDVSGSVAAVAQFLLMFLYSLNEVISDIRSFAFCAGMNEVTHIFEEHNLEDAVRKVVESVAMGSTDYGGALEDLEREGMDYIDNRTTVIILGDGRSNYTNPRADIMKSIFERSKKVIWLNPEPRTFWNTGDSEMRRYLPYTHIAKTTNTVQDLERVVDDLLKSTQAA